MNKKTIALLLSIATVVCQSSWCFADGTAKEVVADKTVMTYNSSEQPAPIVLDFSEDIGGIVAAPINLLTVSLDNGNLKCVSTPTIVGDRVNTGCMYLPLDNVDGEYYNRLKIKAKVESAADSDVYQFALYYIGADKTDGTAYAEAEARAKRIRFTGLTESEGKFSNTEYQEYVVDLSTLSKWSQATISNLRIDPLKNSSGTLYIDRLELYNEPPATPEPTQAPTATPTAAPTAEPTAEPTIVPTAEPTAEPTSVPTAEPPQSDFVSVGDEYIEYTFDNDVDGYIKKEGKISLSTQEGILKYVSEAAYNSSGNASSGDMIMSVDFDISQFYKMEMKVKLDGVTPTFNGGNLAPRFALYYNGEDASGKAYGISSARQLFSNYQAALNEEDGKYYSDWQTIEVDLSKLASWEICSVDQFRIDVIKDAEGTIYIDSIKFYSVPKITELTFDGKADIKNEVPINTKTIVATLSQKIDSVGSDAVRIYDADGIKANIESVAYDAGKKTVTANVSGLESFTSYTFEINKNAKANSKQNLYKPTLATFRTQGEELEYEASGNGSKAEMLFVNKGNAAKEVLLIASIWDGNKAVDKVTEIYSVPCGESTHTFDYSSVLGGNKVELSVWEYSSSTVKKIHGRKVYTFAK